MKTKSVAISLILVLILSLSGVGLSADLQSYPLFRSYTTNNLPNVGGKVYSYKAGSDTPQATYSDRAGLIANANPVVLDAMGESIIYLTSPTKLVVEDSHGVVIKTVDNLGPNTSTSVVDVSQTGADPSKSDTFNATAIQTCFDTLSASGGGMVRFGPGKYKVTNLRFRPGVSIETAGLNATTLSLTGNGPTIYADESIQRVEYHNLTISHEDNYNTTVDMMQMKEGFSHNRGNMHFVGKSGVTRNGLILHGYNPDVVPIVGNNDLYDNDFYLDFNAASEVNGTALTLGEHTDVNNARANFNHIKGRCINWVTSIFVNGQGNEFAFEFGGPNTGSRAIHFYGNGTYRNLLFAYFDSPITGKYITLENTDTKVNQMVQVTPSPGMITSINNPKVEKVATAFPGDLSLFGGTYSELSSSFNKTLPQPGQGGAMYAGTVNDSFVIFGALREDKSGRVYTSGSNFTGTTNAIGKKGSVSICLNHDADASWRLVRTADGTSYTRIMEVQPSIGDLEFKFAGKGIVLVNQAGTVTKRVRLNDPGNGLIFEAP